jgi:DNA mismatch repair protein MutS
MRVKEWKGSVVFLHEVAEGAAGRSWGIHVAELAGVPAPVVRRAASLMSAMEKRGGPLHTSRSLRSLPLFAAATEPDETAPENDELSRLRKTLDDMNPDAMTPKQALEAIYALKALVPACAAEPK